MNVWILGLLADFRASPAALISESLALAKPQTLAFFTTLQIS